MKKIKRFKRGDLILVEFWDHCSGVDNLLKFITLGRLINIDHERILLDYWAYADDKEFRDNNVDRLSVSLGSVISISRLRYTNTVQIERKIKINAFYENIKGDPTAGINTVSQLRRMSAGTRLRQR